MPILSVIVPVYNAGKLLSRCVDSLLSQTFSDFEVILVNDGSTDGSGELCDHFSKLDTRVKVIHKQNAGVSAARNSGIDSAEGEWIGFVDADDYCDPDMFAVLLSEAFSHSADICTCGFQILHPDGQTTLSLTPVPGRSGIFSGEEIYDELILPLIGIYDINQKRFIRTAGAVWMCIFKRKLFDSIRFMNGISEGEDRTVKIAAFSRAKTVVHIPRPLYFYDISHSGLSSKYYSDIWHQRLSAYRRLTAFFTAEQKLQSYSTTLMNSLLYDASFCTIYYTRKNAPDLTEQLDKIRSDTYFRELWAKRRYARLHISAWFTLFLLRIRSYPILKMLLLRNF